jgi:hypothetical protein
MRRIAASVALLAASMTLAAAAQAASLTPSGYTQDFDSMGVSGTAAPTDWTVYTGPSGTNNATWTSTIPVAGVGALVPAGGTLTAITTPTANNNTGYNAAASPSALANRVLATAPTTVSGAALQLLLTNNTGVALNALTLQYDTVRYSAVSSANELPGYWLFYSLDSTNWTNAGLDPTIATVPNTAGTTTTSGQINLLSTLGIGQNVYLRWVDDNAQQTSPDQIIGLNNVNVAPVPLPAALPLLLSALGGIGALARRRRASVHAAHV